MEFAHVEALSGAGPLPSAPEFEKILENAKEASRFLKALAHESRLVILCVLADGEKSVTELEAMLDLRQPTVSQQLARLRMDELVVTRRDGKAVSYRLASEEVATVVKAIYDAFCGR
ncbi:MAG: metalloregulator ArsR/SmtB family transcription factor [Hyphomicrobiales bacterium]